MTENQTSTESAKKFDKVLTEIQERENDLHDKWLKHAAETWKIYGGQKMTENPFNILYSNTEIIVPAVFSKKPTADVRKRWAGEKGDKPAEAMQRMLTFLMDTNLPSYPPFMTAIEDAVLDAALPGLGQIRLRIVDKMAQLDYVAYDKFIWGYCSRWEDCPWISFRHDKRPEDIVSEFKLTSERASAVEKYCTPQGDQGDTDKKTDEKKPQMIAVYETWHKKDKVRRFYCEALDDKLLLEEPDPYRLEGFFPTPQKPLSFVHATTDTLPRSLYSLYQSQAEELNELTRRIKKVTTAIKVRGLYAGIAEIASIFESEENTLIPCASASSVLTMDKGLEAYIWMVPIEKFIQVLTELYKAREQVKSTIYEILGIGDILRGVSKASETLGAQEIKDKWGSLRINKSRERTIDFVRDGLRLLAEGAAKHTPPEQWEQITQLEFTQPVEAQSLAESGQPPPPDQNWTTVLQVLQNDLSRAYTIDIETNSSVDSDATTEKEDLASFMNALGQAMSGLQPLAEMGPEGFEIMKKILSGACRKFQFSQELASQIDKIPVPKALTGPPPEIQKMTEELQQREEALKQAEEAFAADKAKGAEIKANLEEARRAVELVRSDIQRERAELKKETDMAIKELQMEAQASVLKIQTAELARATKALKPASPPPKVK